MKKTLFLLLPLATIAILLSSYSGSDPRSLYPGGAPAGNTGSPADGQNCTHCHGGSASTVQNWITSDVGTEGYIPGQTYTITVTVTGSGNKGFEVSPQNVAGDKLGTLIAGTGNKLAGSGKYVTHSSSSSANPKVWTFQWTAPVSGTGEVTFYGAFALNMSSTRLSTLVIPENTATGIKEEAISPKVTIYPNPVYNNLNVSFNLTISAEVTISLVNTSTGIKTVLAMEYISQGAQNHRFDCSEQQAGLYVLLIESGKQCLESKVLISR
jgi:hypothetical protein